MSRKVLSLLAALAIFPVFATLSHADKPVPTVEISANPVTIEPGESATLSWTSTNATSASIDQGIGDVPVEGSIPVSPTETTIYTITVVGRHGSAWDSVTVTVVQPPEDLEHGVSEDDQQGGTGIVGETVCILNGNNVESRTDLQFPSPNSLGLSFDAYHNSRSGTLGALGYGWTHTYDLSLDPAFLLEGRTYIKIVDRTGRAYYFLEETPSSYKGAFKEVTHVDIEAGDYVWYRLDGTRFGFSATGQLSWIDDEKGNRLQLAYDAQDRLGTVTGMASGRVLTFNYNGGDRLLTITGPVTTAVPDGIWVTYGYDGNQNLTSVTYAEGSGFNYAYADPNDMHNLTEKRDKLNHLLNTWGYDAQDRAVSKFSVGGKGVDNINYIGETQVNVTDAYGTVRTYTLVEIDGHKRVGAMTGTPSAPYSNNNIVRWEYNANLWLAETESAGGTITRYDDWDSRGIPYNVNLAVGTPEQRSIFTPCHPYINIPLFRVEDSVLESDLKGTLWYYGPEWDPFPSSITESGYTKDASGNIIYYTYVTNFTYNSKGQVLSIDGPLPGTDDTTSFSYDPTTGDLLSITQPLLGSTVFSEYDAAGRVGKVTDVNGQSKRFTYDGKGRITTIINDADASSTHITYTTGGVPDSVTDEDNVTRTFDYDTSYGRLSRITDLEGNYIAYAYDAQGNRIEMSKHDSIGTRTARKRWSYQHPTIPGKLWKEINADDTYTEYGYDSEGNISSVKDPNGNTTSYAYDPLNRLKTVTQPGSAVTNYTYDTHGNLTSVTDAEGHITTYLYDDLGRVLSSTSPDTGTVNYVYDEASNLTKKTDAKGIIVQYLYDLLNRLTDVQFPDPAQDIIYSYDAGTYGKGYRTGMTDPSGSTTFSYDARGRLVQKTSTILGQNYTFGQTYSPGGRVSTVTYPTGRTMDYTRDSMGRMQGLSTTYNSTTIPLVNNMTYNPFAGPKGMSTGAGGVVNNQSGECGCLEVGNPGQQMERIYSYDNNRNLTSITATNTPWYDQSFTYDALNRLTDATGRYGVIGYTYDKVGNRLTRTVNGQTETYTYFPGTNKLQEITGLNPTTFSYDANGNITAVGTKTLVYNQNNRLIRVEENSTTLGEYTYNGEGQRVIKTVDGSSTIFHYDLNGKLVGEGLPDGTITREYLYMGKIRMAMVDVASQSVYYYLNDRLGTPQLMTDDTGTIVWEGFPKPFGEMTVNSKSTVVNNLRFPGQYYDQETGLHYNYFRYYDPRPGRYLKPDILSLSNIQIVRRSALNHLLWPPSNLLYSLEVLHFLNRSMLSQYRMRNPETLNLYSYVSDNPTNSIDPNGLFIGQAITHIASAVGGILAGGPGALIGGVAGAVLLSPLGTPGMVLGGIGGGFVGSLLDPVSAGQLNYFEDMKLEHLRRMEEWKEIDMQVQDLLERVNDLNNRMGGPLDENPCNN